MSSQSIPLTAEEAKVSPPLKYRVERECLEELEDFDGEEELQEGVNLEITLEEDENAFDAEYVSNMLHEK